GDVSYNLDGESVTLSRNGANLELRDTATNALLDSQVLADVTSVTVNGADDSSETLTIDFSSPFTIPSSGAINFNGGGGAGSNTLIILGGSFTTATYKYTNAHDGSIVLDSQQINYSQLQPIIHTSIAVTALFNLPAAAGAAVLQDSGVAANPIRLHSNNATFEDIDFTGPTGSLTINRGDANDTLDITVASPGNLSAGLTVGSVAKPFDTITITSALSLTTGAAALDLHADAINMNAAAITTTNTQNFDGAVTLGAGASLTGSTVTFTGTVVGGGNSLDITGNAVFGNAAADT